MRTLDELKEFYRHDLDNELRQLEAERKAKLRRLWYPPLAAAVASTVFVAAMGKAGVALVFVCLILAIIGMVVTAVMITKGFSLAYKQRVVTRLVEFMEPGLRYSPREHIVREAFDESRLFEKQGIDSFRGEDLVTGSIDGVDLSFSELTAVNRGSNSKNSSDTTVFQGLFMVADLGREFRGTTVVVPNFMAKLPKGFLGDLVRKLIDAFLPQRSGQEVTFGDHAFDQQFKVFADDPDQAKALLTDAMRADLLALQKHLADTAPKNSQQANLANNVYVSFVGSTAYIAFNQAKDRFEASPFKTVRNFKLVNDFFADFHLIYSVIATLQRDSTGRASG